METRIYSIRHGESEFNVLGGLGIDELKAATLPPAPLDQCALLTQQGVEQAMITGDAMAEKLRAVEDVTIISSNMERARQTANIILARINEARSSDQQIPEIIVVEDLRENRLGLTEPSYVLLYPEELGLDFDNYWDARRFDPEAKFNRRPILRLTDRHRQISEELGLTSKADIVGESYRAVVRRVQRALKEAQIDMQRQGHSSVMVAHFGVLHIIRAILLKEPLEGISAAMRNPDLDIDNGSITTYRYIQGTGWVLEAWAEKRKELT